MLWLFLRQFRSTLLVGIAIPVSVLATVLVMLVTGHTLNVISIAGIAFAVGMTLDAATIVLESILQRRERGASPAQAALEGATRVWPALFASTLTTVIVFIPVIFMKNTEGQLFADLALTISVAIAVSLVMAMTVLPVAAARWLKPTEATRKAAEWPRRLGERMAALTDSPRRRQLTIGLCLVVPAVLTWLLLPPIDYLPPVKRDAIDGFFQFPPGMNIDAIETEVVEPMAKRLEPYMAGEKEPRLKNYYILIWPNGGGSIGVRPLDPSKIDELGKIVNEEITAGFPDLNVFAQQGNLFGGFGDGRNIEVRLQSSDFDALLESARKAQDIIIEKMPGAQVQSFQDLELSEPELRLVPDDRRISESGWTRANVATVVRALGDGIWVGEHFDGERRLDMILRAERLGQPGRARGRAGRDADRRRRAARRAGHHRADCRLDGPAPRGRPPHDRHQRRRAARHLAAAGDGEARNRSRPGAAAAAAAGRRHPLRRRRGQPRDRARGHARQHLACAARAVPADGGAVPVREGQPAGDADGAAREPRRRARHPVPEPVHAADARHADDGRLHHPAGRRRQQRDPAGRELALGGARRHGPQRAPCATPSRSARGRSSRPRSASWPGSCR